MKTKPEISLDSLCSIRDALLCTAFALLALALFLGSPSPLFGLSVRVASIFIGVIAPLSVLIWEKRMCLKAVEKLKATQEAAAADTALHLWVTTRFDGWSSPEGQGLLAQCLRAHERFYRVHGFSGEKHLASLRARLAS